MDSVFKLVLSTAGAGAVTAALGSVQSSLTQLAGVTTAVTGSLAGVKSALDLGTGLEHLSLRTGQSVLDIAKLQASFKAAGLSAEQVAPSIAKMDKAIDTAINSSRIGDVKNLGKAFKGLDEEGYGAADAFARLGVSAAALKEMTAAQQFQTLAAAFERLPNPVERTAVAMKIFGRNGAELIQLFAKGNPFDLDEGAERLAHRLDEDAPRFAELNLGLGKINTRLQEMWVSAAEQVLPALEQVADVIKWLNLSPLGAGLGSASAFLVPAMTFASLRPLDNMIGALARNSLGPGLINSIQFSLAAAIRPFSGFLATVLPLGLAVTVAAAITAGIYSAMAEIARQRVVAAGSFSTDQTRPAIQAAGKIDSPAGQEAALQRLTAVKNQLEARIAESQPKPWIWQTFTIDHWFPIAAEQRLASYGSQLQNVNHLIAELGTNWATAKIQQNLAAEKVAEFARKEVAATEWLGSEQAKQARDKIAASAAAHRDQEDLLVDQRAMLTIDNSSVSIYERIRQSRALTKQEEVALLQIEGGRADLLKEIEKTEKNVAALKNDFARNIAEDGAKTTGQPQRQVETGGGYA